MGVLAIVHLAGQAPHTYYEACHFIKYNIILHVNKFSHQWFLTRNAASKKIFLNCYTHNYFFVICDMNFYEPFLSQMPHLTVGI